MTIIPYRWELGGGNTTCFFMLYAIAYYIRHYDPEILKRKLSPKRLVLGGYTLAFLSIIVLDLVGTRVNALNEFACYYIRGNIRFFPVLISIGLFLWIVQNRQIYSKIINWVGGLTFAVYLIHMHPLVSPILFGDLFDMTNIVDTPYIIPYTIGVTFCIFLACISVDQIRVWLYKSLTLSYKKLKK